VVLARPSDGDALVLTGAVATVWLQLEHRIAHADLLAGLRASAADTEDDADVPLDSVLDEAVAMLDREGLLAR
jgi:hypothetical protein